jgi:hypothetical protein
MARKPLRILVNAARRMVVVGRDLNHDSEFALADGWVTRNDDFVCSRRNSYL